MLLVFNLKHSPQTMYSAIIYVFSLLALTIFMLVASLVLFFKYKFQHWKKRRVPHLPPAIPLGNFGGSSFTKSPGEVTADIYRSSCHHRYFGTYFMFKPSLLINDPDLIKQIFVADFQSFHDRGVYVDEDNDPLAANLLTLSGIQWRNLRVKLTPTFTSGKLKMMFQSLSSVVDNLQRYLDKAENSGRVFEIKDLMARFTTDVVASCAFGIEANSLENPNSEFRRMGKAVFELTTWESIKLVTNFSVPELARFFRIKQTKQEVEKFFIKLVKETISQRESTQSTRNDFMQLLIQLKNQGYIADADSKKTGNFASQGDGQKFTLNQAAAQAFLFLIGGFETSSTTLQFAFYELAKNTELQNRTRADINHVLDRNNRELTYDSLQQMQFLDKVVSETLRKYPPLPVLSRECTKTYKIPDSDLTLESGETVTIPVYGLHHDPQYYPQPDRFDPERFTEKEKHNRHHYVYLPFGEGPRMCIGNRFGLMQVKAALVGVLSKYSVEFCGETPAPLVFDPRNFILTPKGGVPLKIVPL